MNEPDAATIIETARLRLRPHRPDDLNDLVALSENWEVARWLSGMPHPYTSDHGRFWIDHVRSLHRAGRPGVFAVALKQWDQLIGGIGFDGAVREGSDEPALAYWIGQPYWRNGYGREAVEAVITYGFRSLCLKSVIAEIDPDNTPSRRILLSCGFEQVGEVDLTEPMRRGARRVPLFRILREDYFKLEPSANHRTR
jgi:RimJ/RimL family protein N-acetyltransferase